MPSYISDMRVIIKCMKIKSSCSINIIGSLYELFKIPNNFSSLSIASVSFDFDSSL